MKFLLFSGGSGTKLWPLSREDKPKQFQPLIGGKTLFRINVESLLKAYSAKDLVVSTKRKYLKYVIDSAPEIPLNNVIIEPDATLNSGPGMTYAMVKLQEKYGEEPFMVIQTDDLREPNEKFLEMIVAAEKLVKRDKKFITGGQKALVPDMGVDYFVLGDRIKDEGDISIYKLDRFVERLGDYDKTKELIQDFNVTTHVNQNCWYPQLMLDAIKKHRPDWHEAGMKIKKILEKENEFEKIEKIYSKMKAGPFEEVTKHIFKEGYVIMLPFKWLDFGTWGMTYEHLAKGNGVYRDGNVIAIDTKNSFIKGRKDKLIATIGVDDLLIVDTEDVLFVCPKSRSQEVKKILDELKKKGGKFM